MEEFKEKKKYVIELSKNDSLTRDELLDNLNEYLIKYLFQNEIEQISNYKFTLDLTVTKYEMLEITKYKSAWD